MSEFEDLPVPPLSGHGPFTLYVDVQFRSSVSTGKLTISGDGVVLRMNFLLARMTGARSLTHAGPTIKVTPPSVIPPRGQWLLIESVDGYKAAIRTGMRIERLREMLGMAGVQVVPGRHALRDEATKMLDRPRPPRKDL